MNAEKLRVAKRTGLAQQSGKWRDQTRIPAAGVKPQAAVLKLWCVYPQWHLEVLPVDSTYIEGEEGNEGNAERFHYYLEYFMSCNINYEVNYTLNSSW